MKHIFFTGTLLIFSLSCCIAQEHNSNKYLILNFIGNLVNDDQQISFKRLKKEDYLIFSDKYIALEEKEEVDSMYTIILLEVAKQIKEKCGKSLKHIEILNMEESINIKQFNESLIVPENAEAYIAFCKDEVITRFLIQEGKIAAFSTLSKGGRKYFMTF